MDLNNISIIGRLTADPSKKVLPTGTTLVEFGLANNRGYGDNKRVNFFNVKFFGKGADAIYIYLHKGTQVVITGELLRDEWKSPTGTSYSAIYISTFNVEILKQPEESRKTAEVNNEMEIPF